MSVFELRHKGVFDFAKLDGWDGYYAKAVTEEVKQHAYKVWLDYKLENKEYNLALDYNGAITFEVESHLGKLDLTVDNEGYVVNLYDPETERVYARGISYRF